MDTNGHIVVLDGPSASGKSRLKREILEACPELSFCPRVTTRPPRGDESDGDYRFVSAEEFQELEKGRKLAAWRHFEFGMSYGLPVEPVEAALAAGKTAFCLIDLGTVDQIRRHWPHCTSILLYAPVEQLRGRLLARGGHTTEQVEERLGNASLVWAKRTLYDQVLMNEDGRWDNTLEQALAICRRSTK